MTEATPEDLVEQQVTATGDEDPSVVPSVGPEEPEADVVEQSVDAAPADHVADRDVPLEADAADAAEQASVVELDEDERR